jgi:hypothetical protein
VRATYVLHQHVTETTGVLCTAYSTEGLIGHKDTISYIITLHVLWLLLDDDENSEGIHKQTILYEVQTNEV